MNERRFLLLIGSPRMQSTSEALGRYLGEGLAARGWTTEVVRLGPALKQPEKWNALVEQFQQADDIALCLPLYVDSLPAECTLALERLAAVAPPKQARRLFALVNCGFLEAEHNDVALSICKLFARDTGMTWSGGLALGGGGGINGQALGKLKGMLWHVVRALDLTVEAVDTGQPIPEEALTLIRRRFCPQWMYMLLANFGMLKAALDHHVLTKIHARPYA
jgi:multimeric flavodoxin WrbA